MVDYDLKFLNCFDFLDFFLFIGFVEFEKNEKYSNEKLEDLNKQAIKIISNFIIDIKSLEFSEIEISCSVIKIVREINNFEKNWIDFYKENFLLEESTFQDCYNLIKS